MAAAKLTVKHGQPVYKVALMRGVLRSKVKVDTQTGAMLGIETKSKMVSSAGSVIAHLVNQ